MTRLDPLFPDATIQVGSARGFVTEADGPFPLYPGERIVITAAHCLPQLPPPFPVELEDNTYANLLGPLRGEKTVWAECLFVDPVADVAVLRRPDNQELSEEAEAYERLTESVTPFSIIRTLARPPHFARKTFVEVPVLVKGPGGHWLDAVAVRYGLGIAIEPKEIIEGGMSGSPILDPKNPNCAIAIVSSNLTNPVLLDALPAWLARSIVKRTSNYSSADKARRLQQETLR